MAYVAGGMTKAEEDALLQRKRRADAKKKEAPEVDWEAAKQMFSSAPTYEGEYNSFNQKEGFGTERFPAGDVYEGQFKADDWHGSGKLRYVGGNVYEGEFKLGQKDGQGVYRFASGEQYDGEWKADKREGRGTYRAANGDVYEGEYSQNKRNGKGCWRFVDGGLEANTYKNDHAVGDGVMWRGDGKTAVRLKDGKFIEEITLEEARERATIDGLPMPEVGWNAAAVS